MASMNEILCKYKQRRFRKCLELINSLRESYDDIESFFLENCRLVCESYIIIDENEPVKIFDIQEQHYLFFEKIISLGRDSNSVPLELRLTVTFNFIYWLLFYTDVDLEEPEAEEYLKLINKGLLTVLGRKVTSVTTSNAEKILTNLIGLKHLILHVEYTTALLILELVIVIILYVVKLNQTLVGDCLKVISLFVEEAKHASQDEFLQVKSTSLPLFKFSLCGSKTLSDLNSNVIDYFHLLESTFLFMLEDFNGSLKSLQKNIQTGVSSLWNYLVVLNFYELGNWNLCSKFLAKMSSLVIQNSLKARFHIAQGKLKCVERRHKEALRQFEIALTLSPNCPIIYYYLGQEYGRMGLIDSMVENFEKLVQVFQLGDPGEDFQPNFETVLLDWIHPVNEITEVEAHYALAVSYGLNESFKNAAESFEKVLESLEGHTPRRQRRIIELPSYLTVLHEASIINLLMGNLVRAEQILLDAIDGYDGQKFPAKGKEIMSLCKDTEWLERVIQQELLDTDLEPRELSKGILYTEDLLLFFSRNVIALLILSEIQRIQEIEDYKTTLQNVFSIFSKYLASMLKKEGLDEREKHVLTLVKALAGKTCVRIASFQTKQTGDSDVEKMFKRALSCNKGDRDALYYYYNYLLKAGKNREALKLWNTFSKEKVSIELDSLQSFSLRYILTDKITNRELEKIQREIETIDLKLS